METKNTYLLLLIFFSCLYSSISKIEKSNIINKIEASLILNYYKTNNRRLNIDFKDDKIFNLEMKYKNDSIDFYGSKNYLYTYKLKFSYNPDSLNIFGETFQRQSRKEQEIAKLHLNGLFAVRENDDNYLITISGNSFENFNLLSKKINLVNYSVEELINLKYYNYLPQKLIIDTIRNEFTFFSEVLNRSFVGDYNLDKEYKTYNLNLRNGVLIGD